MFFKDEVEERAQAVWGERFKDGTVDRKRKADDLDCGLKATVKRTKRKRESGKSRETAHEVIEID